MIRELQEQDLEALLVLYIQLHDNAMPVRDARLNILWKNMIEDSNYHIIGAEEDGDIVSSCTCLIIPNLTHGQQPYALIENVVTAETYRRRGLASDCLAYARELAMRDNCYKIMLLTGAKQESTLRFYERAGYNSKDKTAFIQWL